MPNETDARNLPLAWASAALNGEREGVFDGAGWWCTGGLALLAWTALALLLTSA